MDRSRPWYERTVRWGQTNLTEIDPQRYDHSLWTAQWDRSAVQGLIINAGGIIAYYPSRLPLHFRSPYLGDRDLFGEIVREARARDLVVVARMDSNRADERFYNEHPDWFCVDADGTPYRAAGRFIACVNSPYYDEYIPQVLTEIIERYSPNGFADNSWSGLPRSSICRCPHCARRFAELTGEPLPARQDWDDPVYRSWIRWNYDRRIEIWDLFNETTTELGGPDCRWIGMNSANPARQSERFRDLSRICARTPFVFVDHQSRREETGFQENAHAGKLIYGLKNWKGLAAESMAMYNFSDPPFRVGSNPEPEARMWVVSGLAGGIHPWWHHIGAWHADRRQYKTAPPLFTWHRDSEEYLLDRRPVANVGIVWSQDNCDFYGRADTDLRTQTPYFGFINAFIRAGISYVPVHISQLAGDLGEIDTLILPSVGAISDEHCELVRAFVAAGGGLVATGETSLYDEAGIARDDFGLADVFGVSALHRHHGAMRHQQTSWEVSPTHSYLDIPIRWGDGERHPVLNGFEDTDQLPFGGRVECVKVTDAEVLLRFVSPFPAYPPETAWQRYPATGVACAVAREAGGRVVYLPADIDRCFGRGFQPDHARVLSNAVRWTARDQLPMEITGTGTVDCHLYRQGDHRYVLHLVNLSGSGAWRAPMYEYVPVGPLTVTVRVGADSPVWKPARSLVGSQQLETSVANGAVRFDVPRVVDHEVIVLEGE